MKMKADSISYVISEEEFTALKQQITELEKKISVFALELHIDNKQTFGSLGDRSLPFTEHAYMMALERKEFAPTYVDMGEFKKDMDLYKKCKELLQLIEIVHERVLDTYIASGSDALSSARKIYNHVKSLVKVNLPGANVVYEELKKRYKKIKSNSETKPIEEKMTVTPESKEEK